MKTNLRQQLFALTLLAVSLQGVSASADVIMTEHTGRVRPTKFRLNEPVANVSEITYNPLYVSKYNVHVLDLKDRAGKVVAIAEESKFSWNSVIQLKKINEKNNKEELVATLTESADPDNQHASRFSVANSQGVPVALGSSNLIDNEVISYEFSHNGRDEAEARHNTASDKLNEWTIDTRDESVVHPLLIASLITFKRATYYRWYYDFPAGVVIAGLGTGTYMYRDQLAKMASSLKGKRKSFRGDDNGTELKEFPRNTRASGSFVGGEALGSSLDSSSGIDRSYEANVQRELNLNKADSAVVPDSATQHQENPTSSEALTQRDSDLNNAGSDSAAHSKTYSDAFSRSTKSIVQKKKKNNQSNNDSSSS